MIDKLRKTFINQRGFTLMELLIVIAIIAILTVAFLPNALNAPKKARDAVKLKKAQDIQTAVEAYIVERGTLPPPGDPVNCFTQDVADVLVFTLPIDSSKNSSCLGADPPNPGDPDADKFFWKVDGGARFYIIGAKVEVPNSGNTASEFAALIGAGVNSIDTARALISPILPIAANGGKYYITVGPI